MEIQTKLQTKLSAVIAEVPNFINNRIKLIKNFTLFFSQGAIGLSCLVILAVALLQISVWIISRLSFLADYDSTLISIPVNTILNITLIVVTLSYVVLTDKILEQSKEQQKSEFTQQRNQQEFEFIQKRLELFYYPLQLSMYLNWEDGLGGWRDLHEDTPIVSNDSTDEPWAEDNELDEILNNMINDFESYYKYSYLIKSDELKDKLESLQNFLYDERIYKRNYNLRRDIYTNPDFRFEKLCSDINKITASDIKKDKNRLYELLNSESISKIQLS